MFLVDFTHWSRRKMGKKDKSDRGELLAQDQNAWDIKCVTMLASG